MCTGHPREAGPGRERGRGGPASPGATPGAELYSSYHPLRPVTTMVVYITPVFSSSRLCFNFVIYIYILIFLKSDRCLSMNKDHASEK